MLIPATMTSFSFSISHSSWRQCFLLASPCTSLFSSLFKYCLRMTWACLENSFDNFRPQKAIAGNITESCWLSPLRGESGQGRGVKINSQIFSQLLIKISVLIFLFMTRAECAEWERVRDIKRLHINNISPGLSYRDRVTVFAPCLAECYLHFTLRQKVLYSSTENATQGLDKYLWSQTKDQQLQPGW